MKSMQDPLNPEPKEIGNVIFWYKNQVAFTFHSDLNPTAAKQDVIDNLPLDQLYQFLQDREQVTLRSFDPGDVAGGAQSIGLAASHQVSGLRTPIAKYLFPSPGDQGSVLVGFFHIEPDVANGEDHVPAVVKRINETKFIADGVPAPSAMPNWVGAGTGDIGHGCPITPPIAVDESEVCETARGYWPITVPGLPDDLKQRDGEGVTVLVVDTIPQAGTIATALGQLPAEGDSNKLLRDMATGLVEIPAPFTSQSLTNLAAPPAITICHQSLPAIFEQPSEHQPMTGKDIDGNLIGYPMADHGLFVAGIIRTLAPSAKIVCVRALNDLGEANATTIIALLETVAVHVQEEKQKDPDYTPRLVINMSLVVTPYDEQLQCLGLDKALSSQVREGLRKPLQALAELGVVVVAAAGNDSNPRGTMKCMDMKGMNGTRLDARYPAAFGESIPQVIPVGAIDKTGQPALYSNYPGANGVATYGGELPVRDPAKSQPGHTEAEKPIDSPRGVYTAQFYPALSKDDTSPLGGGPGPGELPAGDNYPKIALPNHNAWAYWSGTSFATPIITGLVARILQNGTSANVRGQVIALADPTPLLWKDRVAGPDVEGPVISACQCCDSHSAG